MSLCAIARPHFNPSANSWWDGKLGIWPIGDWEPAKRASKNQPRGTLVWKNKPVIKEVYHKLLISKLLLAIVEKWPWTDRLSRKIWIQQDGAKAISIQMIMSSKKHYKIRNSMQAYIHKWQTHRILTYLILDFSE